LCAIELDDLLIVGRLLHRFVITVPDESREPQRDALISFDLTQGSLVHRAEGQICGFDLPYELWCDPHIYILLLEFEIGRSVVNDKVFEPIVDELERLVGKARSHLAYSLKALQILIVAR